MKLTTTTFLLPALLSSAASAQLLRNSNGNLPSCGQSCSVLTSAQQQCGGASSTSTSTCSCFCSNVWSASNGALTTICATSCSDPSDNTAIEQWYTANCGSDNGASEHGGGSSGSGNGNGGGGSSSPSSSGVAAGPSTTGNSGVSASDANTSSCSSWFNCHWKWVVMIIVLAVGLTILGVGGRWLKKRHDRKQDLISGGFNQGITERNPQMSGPNGPNNGPNNGPSTSFVAEHGPAGGRESPMRTREAFMPYGYGYTRSESRLASQGPDTGSSLARGATPVNELEKNTVGEESNPRKKSRRVLVRERSGADE